MGAGLALAAAGVALAKAAAWPFLVLLPLGAALALAAAAWGPRRARPLFVSAGAALLALAVAEAALVARGARHPFRDRSEQHVTRLPAGVRWDGDPAGHRRDARLGWTRAPGVEVTDRRAVRGGFDIDVCYTFGADGWRVTPGDAPADAPAALFFGDSFAFGLRLADDETLPALFQERSRGRFAALNVAAGGWGPHQTAALLDDERERALLGGRRPALAVYFAVYDPLRPVGWRWWGRGGTRYVLDDAGRLAEGGTLPDAAASRVRRLLVRWALFERLLSEGARLRRVKDLYAALVLHAKETFERRYGAPYVVVLADGSPGSSEMRERLAASGVETFSFEALLPPGEAYSERYRIPRDGHPSRAANARVADFVLSLADGGVLP